MTYRVELIQNNEPIRSIMVQGLRDLLAVNSQWSFPWNEVRTTAVNS